MTLDKYLSVRIDVGRHVEIYCESYITSNRIDEGNHLHQQFRKHLFQVQMRCRKLLCREQSIVSWVAISVERIHSKQIHVSANIPKIRILLNYTVTSHMVQVVSIEQVPMTEESVSFQSKQVKGAQYSVTEGNIH